MLQSEPEICQNHSQKSFRQTPFVKTDFDLLKQQNTTTRTRIYIRLHILRLLLIIFTDHFNEKSLRKVFFAYLHVYCILD